MPRGEHRAANLTPELRAKGARAANESRTAKRLEREAEAQQIWSDALRAAAQAYVDGLAAGTVTVAKDGDEEIIATDHDTRIKAADRITDRMLGRPVQRTELSGPDEGPIVLENDVDADRAAAIFGALESRGLIARGSRVDNPEADEVHPPRPIDE